MTRTKTVVGAATLIVGLGMGCDRSPAEEQERAVEAQQEANEKIGEARQEANEKIGAAREEAAEDIREARQDAVDDKNDRVGVDRDPARVGVDVDNDGVIDRDGVAADRDRDNDGLVDRDREPVRGTEVGAVKDEHHKEIADARKELAEDKAEAQQEANETITDVKEEIAEDRRELREWAQSEVAELDKAIAELSTEAQEADAPVQRRAEMGLQTLRNQRAQVMTQIGTIDNKPAAQLERFKAQLEARFENLDKRVETLRDSMK